jgi:succinyl-diaminopimelate desuccinylase
MIAGMTPEPADVLAAAHADHRSVVDLTQQLVRIPSRGGIDHYLPMVEAVEDWLTNARLRPRRLVDDGGLVVGVVCDIAGGRPGPRYVLDACLDTAPFGDEAAWAHSPTSGVIEDGWLNGRGAADSKAAVAVFCHLGARLAQHADQLRGTATLLFDADEHTGRFGGAREYFAGADAPDDVAGVYIGYPGLDELVVGGRGVWRVRLRVHGVAGHSGSSRYAPNAINKATELVGLLREAALPGPGAREFPLPPKVTVTEIRGGEGFSVMPDVCSLSVDVRLTPDFDATAAQALIRDAIVTLDERWPDTRPTTVEVVTDWPPYRLPPTSALVEALLDGAAGAGLRPAPRVAGPSNIGNYLAGLSIPATAGFGAVYEGLHGTDERIRVDTVPAVQASYHQAILTLLS